MTAGQQLATAIVFPGMSPVRYAEVGEFLTFNAYARKRLRAAEEVLGYPLLAAYRQSGQGYGEAAQVAYLTVCLALGDWAEQELSVSPVLCAGPSLGQRAAAAYAGSLSFPDAVRLTVELARCEEEFFRANYQDWVTLTFLRTPREPLQEVLAELTDRGEPYDISGYLDQDFYLLSLREPMLDWFRERISAIGGYSLYVMRPPVHAPAFGELRRRAEEVFEAYPIEAPRLPVVADQDGSLVTTADAMRTMMLDTFDRPFRWPRMVETLSQQGVQRLCLAGPPNLFARLDATRGFELLQVTPERTLQPAG